MSHRFIDYFADRARALTAASDEHEAHAKRAAAAGKTGDADCIFCDIVARREPGFIVYETDHILAFLDVLPIHPGHTLVVPKGHWARTTELPDEMGAMIGAALPRVARAVCKAMDNPDWNLVSNNGHGQVVDHVHYHIVPAPKRESAAPTRWRSAKSGGLYFGIGLGTRYELDEEEGERVSRLIRDALAGDDKAKAPTGKL